MFDFMSILFPDKISYLNSFSDDYLEDVIINLNLTTIIEYLKEINPEFPSKYLTHLNNNIEISNFRLEIMQEIYENNVLLYHFNLIISKISLLETEFNKMLETNCIEQKHLLFVSLINKYHECIENIYNVLNCELKANGLKNLFLKLDNLKKCQDYLSLIKESKLLQIEVNDALDVILNISLSDKQINIEKAQNFENLTLKFQELCLEVFDVNFSMDFSIVQNSPIAKLEEVIIESIKVNNKLLFSNIEKFYTKYHNFDFSLIILLRHELIFYTTYIKFINLLQEKSLCFCKPSFNNNNYFVENTYDLGLALKLIENENVNKLVTNDINFKKGSAFVLTGANQGGKTTYLRNIGLISILAQAGCLVPGKYANILYINKIFTHFPKEEVVGINNGRLAEEVKNIKKIQGELTTNSLFLINEPFSSTRRTEGLKLLQALITYSMDIGCLTGITTHFYEIVFMNANIVSLITEVNQTRTYKIIKGLPNISLFINDLITEVGLTYDQLITMFMKGDKLNV